MPHEASAFVADRVSWFSMLIKTCTAAWLLLCNTAHRVFARVHNK